MNTEMCKGCFCGNPFCTLTKAQVLEYGPILQRSAYIIMRTATKKFPRTYAFKRIPLFRSFSALIPDSTVAHPHIYKRLIYDEDANCIVVWEEFEVLTPLAYDTKSKVVSKGLSKGNVR